MAIEIRLPVTRLVLVRRRKLQAGPARTVHGHPTFGEALMEAAAAVRK
jgi:hypothetical protein